MAKSRKLSTGSKRDTDWQLKEYQRLMGKDAAERQEHAAKLDRGECVCNRRTISVRVGEHNVRSYRTIHDRECVKFKPWMEEYLGRGNEKAEAFVRSAQQQQPT